MFLIKLFCTLALLSPIEAYVIKKNLFILKHRIKFLSASSIPATTNDDVVRTYVSYVVYKGKAAVTVKPIPPSYAQKTPTSRTVSRPGVMLLEFALSSGPREYDWTNKGTFSLDATECAEVVSFDVKSKGFLEFLHDPNMGSEKAGQITKKLKCTPTQDGKGVFLSLAVNDKATDSRTYSLPVSLAELEVIKNLMSFSIPRFLGFDCVWGGAAFNDAPPPPPLYAKLDD